MKKFQHDDIPPVEKENERDETYQGTNSKIDSTRTRNNIHFVKREQTYIGYINERRGNRKRDFQTLYSRLRSDTDSTDTYRTKS